MSKLAVCFPWSQCFPLWSQGYLESKRMNISAQHSLFLKPVLSHHHAIQLFSCPSGHNRCYIRAYPTRSVILTLNTGMWALLAAYLERIRSCFMSRWSHYALYSSLSHRGRGRSPLTKWFWPWLEVAWCVVHAWVSRLSADWLPITCLRASQKWPSLQDKVAKWQHELWMEESL